MYLAGRQSLLWIWLCLILIHVDTIGCRPTSKHTTRARHPPPRGRARNVEEQLLIDFYDAMGGSSWTSQCSDYRRSEGCWLSDDPYCEWLGVGCDVNGSVVSLVLPNNMLLGNLPEFIANFTSLVTLDLAYNSFTGTISPTWGALTHLRSLDLSNTLVSNFSGLAELPNLRNLSLAILLYPDVLDNVLVNLKHLEALDLSFPGLGKHIPEAIQNLTSLRQLRLVGSRINDLAGLRNMVNLEYLDMSRFDPHVRILQHPETLSRLTKLQYLALSRTPVTSQILNSILPLRNLRNLHLAHTNLSALPDNFFPSFPALTLLDLRKANVHGEIPANIIASPMLSELLLQDNNLRGSIPEGICQLQNLTILNLTNNGLVGSIPPCLGNITSLTILALGINSLVGELPDSLGDLQNLSILDLRLNHLQGNISVSLGQLKNLTELNLAGNILTGQLPFEVGGLFQESLVVLDASNNFLAGELELITMGNPNSHLDLSNNYITGELSNLYPGVNSYVNLAHNQISGSFSIGWGMNNPSTVLLEYNLLRFDLTSVLDSFRYSQVISFRGNRIYGEVPHLPNAIFLDLAYNNLTGSLSAWVHHPDLMFASIEGNFRMRASAEEENILWQLDNKNSLLFSNYSCGATEFLSGFPLEISPTYLNYIHCFCLPGLYGAPPNECGECPQNCICQSGYTLQWRRGFYPVFRDPRSIAMVISCPDGGESQCNPDNNCTYIRGDKGIDPATCKLCADGTTGRLCSQCICESSGSACMFSSNNRCVRCEATNVTIAVSISIGASLIIGLSLIIYISCRLPKAYQRLKKILSNLANSGTLKVLLIFVQTTASLNTMWPHWLYAEGLNLLSITNAQLNGLGFECFIPQLNDPINNLLATLLLVPVLSVILAVILLFTSYILPLFLSCLKVLWQRVKGGGGRLLQVVEDFDENVGNVQEAEPRRRDSRAAKEETGAEKGNMKLWGAYLWIYMLYFVYYGLANRTLEVFNCSQEEITEIRYMARLPWLQCSMNNPTYTKLIIMAGVSLGAYVAGIPALFGGLLWTYRESVHESRVRYWLSNLYYCYKGRVFWFEMVILVRRLILAVLISVLSSDSLLQPSLIMFTLCLALLVQVWTKPFTSKVDNRLEAISIATVMITFIVQYMLFLDSDNAGFWGLSDRQRDIIVLLLALINLAVVGGMILVLLRPLFWWIGRHLLALHRRVGKQRAGSTMRSFVSPASPATAPLLREHETRI